MCIRKIKEKRQRKSRRELQNENEQLTRNNQKLREEKNELHNTVLNIGGLKGNTISDDEDLKRIFNIVDVHLRVLKNKLESTYEDRGRYYDFFYGAYKRGVRLFEECITAFFCKRRFISNRINELTRDKITDCEVLKRIRYIESAPADDPRIATDGLEVYKNELRKELFFVENFKALDDMLQKYYSITKSNSGSKFSEGNKQERD